jgi:hypothetical protein
MADSFQLVQPFQQQDRNYILILHLQSDLDSHEIKLFSKIHLQCLILYLVKASWQSYPKIFFCLFVILIEQQEVYLISTATE